MADLVSGGSGTDGSLTLKTDDDQVAARLFTEPEHTPGGWPARVTPGPGSGPGARPGAGGPGAALTIPASDTLEVGHAGPAGATGRGGNIEVTGASGASVIRISGGYSADAGAVVTIGARGHPGTLHVRSTEGLSAFAASSVGDTVLVEIGHKGRIGQLRLMDAQGRQRVGLDATQGQIYLTNDAGATTVLLDSVTGDVVLMNADIAEEFEVDDDVMAGCVVRIGPSGRLERSDRAYDTAVAGVVSGSGTFRPGIVLDRKPVSSRRLPIAMLGKVMCLADASSTPIRRGALLTSSERPGHAMAVTDIEKAVGAIVGKALGDLSAGQGSIPMLVALR